MHKLLIVRPWILGIVVLCSLTAAVWRFRDLNRDPDIVTQTSLDAWGDPAYYLYNARSFALFGDWRASEGEYLYVIPGYALLAAAWFLTFGAGYAQAAGLSATCGFLIIAGTAKLAYDAAASSNLSRPSWAANAAIASLLLSYIFF